MTTRTKIILGIVGAAAAGVVVGMLLAPDKGTETVKRVKDTAGGWADQLSDLFSNAKTEVENLRSRTTQAASKAANNISDNF